MTNTNNPFNQRSRGNALPGTDPGALEDLLFGMHAGRWALNMQSGEVHCSEKWAEIIGYTIEEMLPDRKKGS